MVLNSHFSLWCRWKELLTVGRFRSGAPHHWGEILRFVMPMQKLVASWTPKAQRFPVLFFVIRCGRLSSNIYLVIQVAGGLSSFSPPHEEKDFWSWEDASENTAHDPGTGAHMHPGHLNLVPWTLQFSKRGERYTALNRFHKSKLKL